MNETQAQELEGVLRQRVPGGTVEVEPEPDGAVVVIETAGQSARYHIGDGPSALLSHLLTRYAD